MDQLAEQKSEPRIENRESNETQPDVTIHDSQVTSEAKPSIFSRVSGWLKDNAALVNENQSLRTELEGKERESCEYVNKITELQAVVERLEVEVSQFRAGAKELEDQLAQREAEAQTASARAVDIVASAGFPQNQLPAVQQQEAVKSAQQWLDEYNSITDPAARTRFLRDNKEAIARANAELKAKKKP